MIIRNLTLKNRHLIIHQYQCGLNVKQAGAILSILNKKRLIHHQPHIIKL